jgi:DNA-binding MarR family transcriptional regulator
MAETRTDQALRAIRRVLRAADMSERLLAEATRLTPSQLLLLQEVAQPGQATPGALAAALHFSQATVTNLVDRLEALDLVERKRGERDRRQIWVVMTPKGRDVLAQAPDLLQSRFASRFKALPDWEQAMMIAMLERLNALLDAENIDAAPLIETGGPIDGPPAPSVRDKPA